MVELLGKAGWWHDQGKRDRRFQAWLHGSELMALAELSADRPLAKSGRDPKQWQSSAAFGYPRGSRHEFISVRVFEEAAVESGEKGELIRFLIGTHHGHGRLFPPVLSDPTPVEVSLGHDGKRITTTSDHRLYRLDSGWVDLFWRMVRRYGWWGIAYLEALLITADRSVSAREQRVTPPHVRVAEANA
jgi:CRISPR-associated endonuclease/helicase Cas3